MPFSYKVGYGSYEESQFAELIHEAQYSAEELHAIVVKAIIRVLEGVISKKYDPFLMDDGISYEEVHEFLIEELKADGFKEVQYQAEWSCFGWPSITDADSWKGQRGDMLDRIFSEIPDELKAEINARGKKRRAKDDAELQEWADKQEATCN